MEVTYRASMIMRSALLSMAGACQSGVSGVSWRPADGRPPHYILYLDRKRIRVFLDNLNKLEIKLRSI